MLRAKDAVEVDAGRYGDAGILQKLARKLHAVARQVPNISVKVKGTVRWMELAKTERRQSFQKQVPVGGISRLHLLQFPGRIERCLPGC